MEDVIVIVEASIMSSQSDSYIFGVLFETIMILLHMGGFICRRYSQGGKKNKYHFLSSIVEVTSEGTMERTYLRDNLL